MSEIPPVCASFEEDLSALLDGELGSERAAAVRAHVATCSRCGPHLAELERVDSILASAPLPALPPDLRERLEARLREAPRGLAPPAGGRRAGRGAPRRARRWLARPAWGAAVAAAALALYLAVRSDRPGPPGAPAEPPQIAHRPEPPAIERPSAPEPGAEGSGLEIAVQPAPPEGVPELAPEAPALEVAERSPAPEVASEADLEVIADEDLAMILEIETLEDLEVIANIDLLERIVALEGGAG